MRHYRDSEKRFFLISHLERGPFSRLSFLKIPSNGNFFDSSIVDRRLDYWIFKDFVRPETFLMFSLKCNLNNFLNIFYVTFSPIDESY